MYVCALAFDKLSASSEHYSKVSFKAEYLPLPCNSTQIKKMKKKQVKTKGKSGNPLAAMEMQLTFFRGN